MPGTPPAGYHTATPHLIVRGATAALEFYGRAFGAEELFRLTEPGGSIAHAEIRIGDSIVMLAEENEAWGNLGPVSLGASPVRVHLYVADVDSVVERAVAAGATVDIPVSDQFYGDRSGRIVDPFGHAWILGTRREDLTPEEMQTRFEEFLASMGGE